MKKIIAAACAGALAVSMGIASLAIEPKQWRNFWLDYGYNQGTSRTEWGGEELRVVNAQVRRRSDEYVVKYSQVQSYNKVTVTVPSTWNYSTYKNQGFCYVEG